MPGNTASHFRKDTQGASGSDRTSEIGDARNSATTISTAELNRAFAALEELDELARELNLETFDWEEWKAYRDEGRP